MSNVQTNDPESAAALDAFTEALARPDGVRIEFGLAFGGPTGSIPTATIWVRDGKRWRRLSPFITPSEGGGRAELLQSIAAMVPEGC